MKNNTKFFLLNLNLHFFLRPSKVSTILRTSHHMHRSGVKKIHIPILRLIPDGGEEPQEEPYHWHSARLSGMKGKQRKKIRPNPLASPRFVEKQKTTRTKGSLERMDTSFPSLETRVVQRNQNPSLKVFPAKIFCCSEVESEKDEKSDKETLPGHRKHKQREMKLGNEGEDDIEGHEDEAQCESEDDSREGNPEGLRLHASQRRFSDFCVTGSDDERRMSILAKESMMPSYWHHQSPSPSPPSTPTSSERPIAFGPAEKLHRRTVSDMPQDTQRDAELLQLRILVQEKDDVILSLRKQYDELKEVCTHDHANGIASDISFLTVYCFIVSCSLSLSLPHPFCRTGSVEIAI
eukprot:TRINITY_DN609_c0_g1_i14.p1 TRINITY_DN609_c0_g1~~TRINITY_DN609_c0_g1_i14.p1  ORF type:complete len:350 (-),score=89.09 TRINITY_DN609_c0_g1_i14:651-1700(-)